MKRIPVIAACLTLGVVLLVSVLIAQQNQPASPYSLTPGQASDTTKKKMSPGQPAPAQQSRPTDLGGSGGGMGMGSGNMGMVLGMPGMGSGYPTGSYGGTMMGATGSYGGNMNMGGMGGGPMFDPDTAQAFAQAVRTLQSDEADETTKEEARKLITDQLRLQFDRDQANRRRQIEELERKIAQLREQLDKREEAKERLVELRIMLLENESAGLGFPQQWNQLPGMSGQSGMGGMMGGMGGMGGTGGTGGMDMGSYMHSPMPGPNPLNPGPALIPEPAATPDDPSANNLKQIALAVHNFHSAHKAFPAAYSVDREGKPLLSWRVHLLPYLGHADLYKQFRLDEAWDSQHNRTLVPKMPDVYRSPSIVTEEGTTLHLGNAGKQGAFGVPRDDLQGIGSLGFAHIMDGLSNTIMVVQCNAKVAKIWTSPEDFVYEDHEDPWPELLNPSGDGFQAVMCDGKPVAFDKSAVTRSVLTALFTRSGGEVIPWEAIKREPR